jgi:hypothetical protein
MWGRLYPTDAQLLDRKLQHVTTGSATAIRARWPNAARTR